MKPLRPRGRKNVECHLLAAAPKDGDHHRQGSFTHGKESCSPSPPFLVVSPYVGCPIWAPHVIDLKVISKFTITRSTAKHYIWKEVTREKESVRISARSRVVGHFDSSYCESWYSFRRRLFLLLVGFYLFFLRELYWWKFYLSMWSFARNAVWNECNTFSG